ncbi:MAG: cupin domain-containing protein [Thermodesulfobacteriota bacterium]
MKGIKIEYDAVDPYTTKDGSIIRELIHPDLQGNKKQSLAEATIPPDFITELHRHVKSEEIYHILSGTGRMVLEMEQFEVGPGDSILIPPGTPHQIQNNGTAPLKILCCCAPAYTHADTELMTSVQG